MPKSTEPPPPRADSSPLREATEGVFAHIRTDQELAELVRDTAKREQKPYAKLVQRLAGDAASLDESTARDTWLEAVERRRTLVKALGRPVHLQVAFFDLLHDRTRARPKARKRASVASMKAVSTPGAEPKRRRRSSPPAPLPWEKRPMVVFATSNARLFGEAHTALAKLGFPVLPARDAPTALTLAGLTRPRVLLIDVLLPPRGGTRLLSRLPPAADEALRLMVLPEGWFAIGRKLAPEVGALMLPLTEEALDAMAARALGRSLSPIEPLADAREGAALAASIAELCRTTGRPGPRRAGGREEADLVARLLGA